MENDLITLLINDKQEKFKLLSIIDDQYIVYTPLDNYNPTSNIYIIKVKSINELELIPIDKMKLEVIKEKYSNLLK